MRTRGLLPSILLLPALACIGPNHRPAEGLGTGAVEQVIQKNYQLGVARTVLAGEPIAQVRQYALYRNFPKAITLDQAITIKTENRTLVLPHGRVLNLIGPAEVNQNKYIAYRDSHDDEGLGEFYYFLPDMSLAPQVYIKDKATFPTGLEPIRSTWPARVRLNVTPVSERILQREHSYDIIFSHKDAAGIHLIYQKYQPDGTVLPASVQHLTLRDGPMLQCQDTRIRVIECTEGRMVASIVADFS